MTEILSEEADSSCLICWFISAVDLAQFHLMDSENKIERCRQRLAGSNAPVGPSYIELCAFSAKQLKSHVSVEDKCLMKPAVDRWKQQSIIV